MYRVLEPTKPPVEEDEAPKDVADLLEAALLEESKPDYETPLNMVRLAEDDSNRQQT